MKKIKTLEEFYTQVEKDELTFVYFYTTWCPDCFMVKPFLPRLEKEHKEMTFIQVDRDDLLDLSSHLGIYGIPSFLLFKNGEELGRFVDKNRKSYLQVKEFIENTI